MFWRKNASSEPVEPRRGRGGGRVRTRPMRRERTRRQPRLADSLTLAALPSFAVVLIYRFVLKLNWPASLALGLVVLVACAAVNYWSTLRRWRKHHPPPTTRRRR